MTGNRTLLTNFMEKFFETVRFGNNNFVMIAGFRDVVIGFMTIKNVYYVEGLGHNLFSVGQFYDKGLEVAFRKSTCFVRNEDGVDLLTGDRSSNLYTIALNEVASNSSTCLLAKAFSSQSWKAAVLYEYESFKATEGELLLDTYIRYLQVINDLKKCGYSKDNCELNFKFLKNLQPEWKHYAIMMRHNKNLMDINIDALYNILKQNQGDVNDAMGSKKKTVVVTSDPLALIAEKTKVSKSKEKVVVSSDSEESDADDFSE
uniref:Integrase, catalytic region, zinc finger, CCHC-type, peptidase aspartic, catalytic n=1 Tax=Tanacetum cinerariifolium TaxID=118510 RepID=A0A699JYF7_TANCI|nr:integrase, catalytic region, zinc finger, CCHC-type, peptidase aspartic, catalytic [Tanacetum cinerariifolium]